MKSSNSILNRIQGQKIIVVGDVMIDSYSWGSTNRISPEAPVPIVSVSKQENRLGGAANVALNLKSLGACPIICSVVGNDNNGDIFYSLLQKNELSTKGMIQSKERKTTKKTRIISRGQQLLRIDDEIAYETSSGVQNELLERIQNLVESEAIEAIIFEDYDKGCLTPYLIEKITELANKKGIIISVDPKKENYNAYTKVNLFKPNFKEFVEGGKLEILKADIQAMFDYAKVMIKERSLQYLFITLSELGVFITDGNTYEHIPAEFRQINDVSGAGDTVISVATLLLTLGCDMKEVAEISNIAGGLVCEHSGVVPIDKEELSKEIQK